MKAVLKLVLMTMLVCCLRIELSTIAAETGPGAPGKMPPGVKPLDAPGLHNLFALGTNVYSGSAPEGDEAFAALARLGVKTIITVDGAKPNVELAHKHGMRYVHIPHGYDGISPNAQAQLMKAAQTLPGPVFVHCHHGLHRSPAAAAVICMANNGWTPSQGEAWLKTAGTGSNYLGLYQTVREFRPPTAERLSALPSEFPETNQVSGLVDMMVEIDDHWDHLKAVRKAGYQVPKEHPDIQPAHEAVILWEHYREAQRLPEAARHGEKFLGLLKSAEAGAKEAEQLLRQFAAEPKPENRARLDKSFDALAQSCTTCHRSYRDPAGIKARQ
jgi:protein-tyrosine phosphatase